MKKILALMIGAVLILCFAGTASALKFSHKQQTNTGPFSNSKEHYLIWEVIGSIVQPTKYTAVRNNVRENPGTSHNSNRYQNGWGGGFGQWTPGNLSEIVVSPPFRNPFFAGLVGNLDHYWDKVNGHHGDSPSHAAPVPEPATMLLLGAGLIGLAGTSRKRWIKR